MSSATGGCWRRSLGTVPMGCRHASTLIRFRPSVLLAVSLSFLGCTPREGRVAIEFTWDSEPPPSSERSSYDLHVAIEERIDVERPGRVLQTAGAKLANSAHLVLGQVPNGDNRVAVIEVRRVGTSTLVRYFGLSEKFSLKAGDQRTVGVHLQLRRAPRFGEGVSLSIEGATAGRVRRPDVTVRVRAHDAYRILLAKDPNFTIGVSQASARSTKVEDSTVTPGLAVYDVAYDLNAGLDCRSGQCIDGPRAVFGKVLNAQDYASDVALARVELDTTGPAVIPRSVSVVLIPSARNVLRSVTRVREGTIARINFTLDKPVGPEPVVVVTRGASALAFTLTASSAASFVYEHLASGTEVEGSYGATVTATDLAGNTRTSTLALPFPGIVIDQTPPAAPDPTRMVYHRVPWGSEATGGVPSFSIRSSTGAVEGGATVIAYDGPNPSNASEIGQIRSTAGPWGAFAEIDLFRADRAKIYVVAVDEAGNVSAPTLVSTIQWVATLTGKVSGNRWPNPHRLETTPVASDALRAPDAVLREPSLDPDVHFTRMNGSPVAALGGDTWTQVVRNRSGPPEIAGLRNRIISSC